MKMNQQVILDSMSGTGMIPVFNHANVEIATGVLDAAYAAGIKVFEFTNRGTHSLEVFSALKLHSEKYQDLFLGIGTIFSVDEAKNFLYAGADFIVSPALVPEVALYCTMKGVLWIPGCATVTEVFQAKTLGAKLIKAFPGNLLGPDFIKAVKSIMPDVKLMPTGGVEPTAANLTSWFNSGVFCVGMGSQLFDKKEIENKEFDVLTKKIKEALETIQEIRK
ncbi:bifunctional 4-hydroxy-2-oxoglutarate aldolase/2-dehydro-3-deoxy-phosphogluconate aldolase [Rhodonellum sp.]|uniref:bifunctional 4-hydroxy-2-oxoglutarate aldolase/2-dehydro-3-deoxy-phosphogluconate aldolase n=1 Tax=Rhodonellum sp. TaxID=2231180 RepID=UPI002727796F|nr:bifunctional 4-hydroxy-2-oxoglutarate aldolase/2-dehydro-3-deoxy-phosphogluconate aldolase [Rhodonellum sp.]MDO9554440.1 bifunctional 4-hydroxy-2-oxoglutarate aldolase/2-dehydro-3-deoxy-phosphogluconate aldolase [Rhodonellum sp.]